MKTPFTTGQFFSVFDNYNTSVFPAQLIILLTGIVLLYLLIFSRAGKTRVVGAILGLIWIWMGAVYHILFFSSVNPLAYAFGGLFMLQGIFFLRETVAGNLKFLYSGGIHDILALVFVLSGLVIYPLVSYFARGEYSGIISFGLPCPTTIVTFGFLMLMRNNRSGYLFFIPTLWALIGTTAAIKFGVYQDFFLLITAVVANVARISRKRMPAPVHG